MSVMTEGTYYRCPEYDCTLTLRKQELSAHLEWDHNYSGRRLHQKVDGAEEFVDSCNESTQNQSASQTGEVSDGGW
jgi:hypothetical protein